MSSVALCPKCAQQIAIPIGEDGADGYLVCPLCEGQFTTAEALPSPAPPMARRLVAGRTEKSTPPDLAPAEPAASDKVLNDAVLNVAAVTATALQAAEASSSSGDGALRTEYVINPRTTSGASSTADRSRRSSGMVGQLVRIVGGGGFGLLIGYCILLRLGGPPADFLEVSDRLPAWVVGKSTTGAKYQPLSAPPVQTSDGSNSPFHVSDASPPDETADAAPAHAPTFEGETHAGRENVHEVTSDIGPQGDDYIGPRDFTWFTSDELGDSLAVVEPMLGCPACDATGYLLAPEGTNGDRLETHANNVNSNRRLVCPTCGGGPTGKITLDVYAALAELAECVTFIKIDADDPSIAAHRERAVHLLARAGGTREKVAAIGRLAAYWMTRDDRPTDGVLLAGTVKGIAPDGRMFRSRLVLFGLGDEATVVSARVPPYQPGDRVLVMGSIIEEPAHELIGYVGDEPRVVWGGLPVVLRDASN